MDAIDSRIQPVIIVDDIRSGVSSAVVSGSAPGPGTPPSSGTFAAGTFPSSIPQGGTFPGWMCNFYRTEGAAGLIGYTYDFTVPQGEWWHIWRTSMTMRQSSGGTVTATGRIRVNPLGSLASSYGSGKYNAWSFTQGLATAQRYSRVAFDPQLNGTTPDPQLGGGLMYDDTDAVLNATSAPFAHPMWLPGGSQIELDIQLASSTFDLLRTWMFFSVLYG